MVVLAIIVVISVVVLASQSSFNKTIILTNTAYDVALTLRSAETYGLSSRVTGASANAGYGINFQKATPGSFILFVDFYPAPSTLSVCHPTSDASSPSALPGDCVYQPDQGERVSEYVLGNGITIADFCIFALDRWWCAYAQGGGLSSLDIVFARPNPDPFMSVNGLYFSAIPISAACLALTSPQGGARFISVAASGQIVANAASCP